MTDAKNERRRRLPHRGADGDMAKFASAFLEARFEGFEKDMRICLTANAISQRRGLTAHSVFRASRSDSPSRDRFGRLGR